MNKLFCVILVLIACRICDAQTPDWLWARSSTSSDTSGYGFAECMATDAFGNVFVASHFMASSISFGPFTLYGTSLSYGNAYIVKYDSSGNILWAKNAVGTGNSYVLDIATDNSGNVYLTGVYGDSEVIFDSDTLNYTTFGNLFLVKYDSSGNVQWARNAGGISPKISSRTISIDNSGNVYIAGSFSGASVTFGSYVLTNSGFSFNYSNIFIAKYDSSGNVIWATSTPGGDCYGIVADLSGNIYITGVFPLQFIVFGSDTLLDSLGTASMYLAKYDSSGNAIWARNSNGALTESGNEITISNNNDVYVRGYFNSPSVTFGSVTLLNNTTSNNFFVKYDSSGNALWVKSYNNGWTDNYIVADSIGNFYMCGRMYNTITFDSIVLQLPFNSYRSIYIVKCDPSGTALWAKALYSGGLTNAIGIGTGESIYVSGAFRNFPLIVASDTLIPTSKLNIFVARLGYSSGVGTPEISSTNELMLFPNPFDDKININSSTGEQSEVVLYDISSRTILEQKFNYAVTLNTTQLAKGMYLYEVRSRNVVVKQGKVVKN